MKMFSATQRKIPATFCLFYQVVVPDASTPTVGLPNSFRPARFMEVSEVMLPDRDKEILDMVAAWPTASLMGSKYMLEQSN